MIEALMLPSGFVAEVSPPKIRALLSGLSLVEASLATDGLAECDLTPEDRETIELWAAEAISDDSETAAYAQICEVFGVRPSADLGIRDPIVAFVVDNVMVGELQPRKR